MPENQRTTSGGGSKLVGICLIILGGLLYAALGGPDDNPAGLFGPIVMIVGLFMYFRGRQKAAKAKAADPAGPLNDSRPDVLYLRSFQTDTATTFKKLTSGFTTAIWSQSVALASHYHYQTPLEFTQRTLSGKLSSSTACVQLRSSSSEQVQKRDFFGSSSRHFQICIRQRS